MGVAGAVAGTFGIQPLVGAFGVPYQAAEPMDERQIRVPLRNSSQISQGAQRQLLPFAVAIWPLNATFLRVSLNKRLVDVFYRMPKRASVAFLKSPHTNLGSLSA